MKIKPIFVAILLLGAFALPAQNTIGCAAASNAKTVPVTTKTGTSAIFTQPTPVKVPPTGPTGPNADKRFVFWMHGLGGDDGAWQDAFAATETNVANGYPARDCYNRVMDYSNCQQYGLPDNCYKVVEQIPQIVSAWQRGVNWWDTANDRYRALIGALEYQTQTGPECRCQACYEWEYTGECTKWGEEYVHDLNDCTNEGENGLYGRELRRCSERMGTFAVKNTKPADGIVLAESAGAYPIGNGQYAPAEEMPRSNHQQMRNDRNTKISLLKTFGGTATDAWFTTPVK